MNHETAILLLGLLGSAFLGSWHCAAMCGPIAASLSRSRHAWSYHLGRGCSYMGIGLLAGGFGQMILPSLPAPVRISIIVLLAFILLAAVLPSQLPRLRLPRLSCGPLKTIPLPLAGALSIFLPCGWLWSFIAAAVATRSAYAGGLVMAALWLGSLPSLIFIDVYFRRSLSAQLPQGLSWAPLLLAGSGLYALFAHFLH